MDTTRVIHKLNDILRWEWTGVAQYMQQSFVVTDVWREVYAPMFRKSAEESLRHATLIGDKIAALGGIPTVERFEVKQTPDLHEMLRNSLEFERGAVQHYREALELCADDRPLTVLLEDIILEEQDGVDHLEKLLRQPGQSVSTRKQAG